MDNPGSTSSLPMNEVAQAIDVHALTTPSAFPSYMMGIDPNRTAPNFAANNIHQIGNVQMLNPQHPMFHEMQARAAIAGAANGPVLLERTHGGALELSDEIGKIAAEGVEESVRCVV